MTRLTQLEKELEDQKVDASVAANDELTRVNLEWAERIKRQKTEVISSVCVVTSL